MEATAVYQETGANAILSLVFDLSNGAATFKSGADTSSVTEIDSSPVLVPVRAPRRRSL